MSSWSDEPSDFARGGESPQFPTERLPGDPEPTHGPEFDAPADAEPEPQPEEPKAYNVDDYPDEDRGGLFSDIRLSTPVLIIVGSLVLALVIGGALYFRSQRVEDLGGPQSEPGQTELVPREGEPPEVQVAEVGDRIHVQGLYGTGWLTVVTADWSDQGSIEPSRGAYLNVDLLVEVEEGTLLVKSTQYMAYDLDANSYVPTIGADKQPYLQDEQLTDAGAEARGWVSFDMPKGPTRVEITDEGYNPLMTIDVIPPG